MSPQALWLLRCRVEHQAKELRRAGHQVLFCGSSADAPGLGLLEHLATPYVKGKSSYSANSLVQRGGASLQESLPRKLGLGIPDKRKEGGVSHLTTV